MTTRPIRTIMTAASVVAMTTLLTAQERDRTKVPDKFKWNLADVYPSDAAWRAEKDRIAAELPKLRQFQFRSLPAQPVQHRRFTLRQWRHQPAIIKPDQQRFPDFRW